MLLAVALYGEMEEGKEGDMSDIAVDTTTDTDPNSFGISEVISLPPSKESESLYIELIINYIKNIDIQIRIYFAYQIDIYNEKLL